MYYFNEISKNRCSGYLYQLTVPITCSISHPGILASGHKDVIDIINLHTNTSAALIPSILPWTVVLTVQIKTANISISNSVDATEACARAFSFPDVAAIEP